MTDDNPFLKVFQVWAAMAWADGHIDDREAAAMKALIDQANLEPEIRTQALSFLDSPVELEREELGKLPLAARQGVYQAAARLALVDSELAAGEIAFLDKLKGALELSDDDTASIEGHIGLKRPR